MKGSYCQLNFAEVALRDLDIPRTIDTSSNDLSADFFIPMLKNSSHYQRGVGYFSSGWFRANAKGMIDFADNRGYAQWITSPMLSEKDWEYLQKGEKARRDSVLREALLRNVNELAESLEKDTLSALAWMIADGILEFKLAVPKDRLAHGEFHDKFGIFYDDHDNSVSFNGSYNDSLQGLQQS